MKKYQTKIDLWYKKEHQFWIDDLRHIQEYEAAINAMEYMWEGQYAAAMKYVKRSRQLSEIILTITENRYFLRILKELPPENNTENLLAA
jgi:hypothetical protein